MFLYYDISSLGKAQHRQLTLEDQENNEDVQKFEKTGTVLEYTHCTFSSQERETNSKKYKTC